jgi:hypothetical protein
VSVKDRWVSPHEQVLNIPIACRWYRLGKPTRRPSTQCWICPYCFIGWPERETGYRLMDQSVGVLCIVSGTLFLRSSGTAQLCGRLRERLLCVAHEIRMVWDHTQTERGICVACWSDFPCKVYINSNHRDSRIWVPLICGSHHIDNFTNLMSLSVGNMCCLIHSNVCNSCLSRVGCTLLWNDLNRAKTWK